MKKTKKIPIVLSTALLAIALSTVFALSACRIFLGPDPDDSNRGIFETIWSDFDRTYALFEHKNVNWRGVYNEFSPFITENLTPAELMSAMEAMLSRLMDTHVYIAGPSGFDYLDWTVPTPWDEWDYNKNARDDFRSYIIADYHVDFIEGPYEDLSYGRFKSNTKIGYLRIATFFGTEGIFVATGNWAKEIDRILQTFADTEGLVLDIRQNGGGMPSNLEYLANRFASKAEDYMSVKTKNGPGRNDFSTPIFRRIRPDGTTYTKPIVLLTNADTTSCAEMFTLALRTQDHVTHVGSNTTGALSVRIIRPLINGWEYSISVQMTADMNGVCHERIDFDTAGIPPDILIPSGIVESYYDEDTQNWQDGSDTQLMGAFDELLKILTP